MAKHYLVTGGAGFIGSHLVDALVADGHHVSIIDDFSTGKHQNIQKSTLIDLHESDCGNPTILASLIPQVDGVFHLAAVASVQRSKEEWAETHRVNQTATVALLDAIAKDGRKLPFVYASSAAVFGDPDDSLMPLAEDTPLAPLTPYGADKAGCELHARAAQAMHAIPTLGFRFFNVYGPRQDPSSPYSGVISIFTDRMRKGESVTIFGDGNQTRDFVYVSDIVSCLTNAMIRLESNDEQPPHILHACTGVATNITALAKTIAGILGSDAEIHYQPARDGDIQHSLGNPATLRACLPLTDPIPLKDGLTLTLKE